jgi:hypothetical protein
LLAAEYPLKVTHAVLGSLASTETNVGAAVPTGIVPVTLVQLVPPLKVTKTPDVFITYITKLFVGAIANSVTAPAVIGKAARDAHEVPWFEDLQMVDNPQ